MSASLVLLHGFTGLPESWARVIELLERTAAPGSRPRVFAPAMLGHDGTPGPAGPPDPADPAGSDGFEAEVDRLAELIRRGAHAPSHLVGYSLGGRLALGLLVRHPGLFRSATLIGASPGLAQPTDRRERAARDEEWARLLDEEGLDTFVAAWEGLPIFASQGRLEPDVLARQDRIRRSHDAAGLARSLRVVGLARMPDYRPRLGAVDVPVRLVVGERDRKFRQLAAEMAERLPRGRLTLVPDAGHNVVLERPTELAGLLREDMHA